jgi:hypothetical protein
MKQIFIILQFWLWVGLLSVCIARLCRPDPAARAKRQAEETETVHKTAPREKALREGRLSVYIPVKREAVLLH